MSNPLFLHQKGTKWNNSVSLDRVTMFLVPCHPLFFVQKRITFIFIYYLCIPYGNGQFDRITDSLSRYNKSWPHVTSSVSKVKRNQAARSNCSSSRRCHRSAHRGSTWFLLSHCKDRYFSVKSKLFLSISSFSAKYSLSLQVQCGNN